MLQNAYFLAKISADTAENEQHFAEILPKARDLGRGRGAAGRGPPRRGGAVPGRWLSLPEACEFVFLTSHSCEFASSNMRTCSRKVCEARSRLYRR